MAVDRAEALAAHIARGRVHYLDRVVAADKEAAIDKVRKKFKIEPARRFRLIAEPVE